MLRRVPRSNSIRTRQCCPYTYATHVALTPGTRLGVYDIIASIGQGGMVQGTR